MGFDICDGSIDVLGDDVPSVEEADRHVFPVLGVTLHHLVLRLEAGLCDHINTKTFVRRKLCGDQRSVGGKRVVNTGIGNKVCLELIEVNIEGPVKSEAGRDGGYNLGNESVEVGVGGSFNREVVMAEVVDCLQFTVINYLMIAAH